MPNKLISHIIFWYDHPFLVNNGEKNLIFMMGKRVNILKVPLCREKCTNMGLKHTKRSTIVKKKKNIKILLIL